MDTHQPRVELPDPMPPPAPPASSLRSEAERRPASMAPGGSSSPGDDPLLSDATGRLSALMAARRDEATRPPGRRVLRTLDGLHARARRATPAVGQATLDAAFGALLCTAGPAMMRLRGPLRRIVETPEALRGHALSAFLAAARLLGVERLVLPLPTFDGAFELDPQSDLTRPLWRARFEAPLLPVLDAALADGRGDVIDIGANLGLYSVRCGRRLPHGRVLAVEPAPTMLPVLAANLARNQLKNVIVYPGAVGAAPGLLTLCFTPGREEYAALGPPSHPQAPKSTARAAVPVETIDHLVEAHGLRPLLIKLDTEGAEAQVLAGAARTLARRPILLCELDDRLLNPRGASARGVIADLIRAGYAVHDVFSGAALEPATLAAPFVGEILALPRAAGANA